MAAPVNHLPAITYPVQQGANRNQIITWGLPTKVAYPGSANGNTPPVDPNAAAITPWAALAVTDTCEPVFCAALTDRSMQITGTAGGASITLQGSNDGVNYVTLTDVQGSPISAKAPGTITQISETTLWVKAVLTGGDGTTALNVILVGKKPF